MAFEHRDFPLPKHSWSRRAAIAARYFESIKPEYGLAFRRETMAHLRDITPDTFTAYVGKFAQAHGIEAAKAVQALDRRDLAERVEADYQDGIARGVSKTPTVLVNGQPLVETFTVEEISKGIEAALAESSR